MTTKEYEPLYGKDVALYYRERDQTKCYFRGTITRETDATIMVDVRHRYRGFYHGGGGGKIEYTPARCVIIPKVQIVYVMDMSNSEDQKTCPTCGHTETDCDNCQQQHLNNTLPSTG